MEEESEVGHRRMEVEMLGEKERERPKQKNQKQTVGVKKYRSQTGARWEEQAQKRQYTEINRDTDAVEGER